MRSVLSTCLQQVADGLACVGAPWHFREIEVLNQSTGVTARFLYDNWLDRTRDNPTATVTLKEINSAEAKAGILKVRGVGRGRPGAVFCNRAN